MPLENWLSRRGGVLYLDRENTRAEEVPARDKMQNRWERLYLAIKGMHFREMALEPSLEGCVWDMPQRSGERKSFAIHSFLLTGEKM